MLTHPLVAAAAGGRFARTIRRRGLWIALAAVLLSGAVFYAERVAWHRSGLVARYYAGQSWSGSPALTRIEPVITTPSLRRTLLDLGFEEASVTWSGFLHVSRACSCTIEAMADDGARVDIDGRGVLDGAIDRGSLQTRAGISLAEGRHVIWVRYYNARGESRMDLRWACEGEPLGRVAAEHLWTYPPTAFQVRYARPLRLAAAGTVAAWVVALLSLLTLKAGSAARRTIGRLRDEGRIDRWVALPLGVGAVLFVTGVTWGLPSFSTWGADELIGADFLDAVEYRFRLVSRYPPLHTYLLSVAAAPVLAAERLGLLDSRSLASVSAMLVVARSTSLLMGLGSLVLVYLTAQRVFGRIAGVTAALGLAGTTTFVYYAKVANLDMPYVFWFLLSYYFYVRLWARARVSDSVLFALAATAAVCTKDQAYALYLLPPAAVAARFLWLLRTNGSGWRAVAKTFAVMGASALAALIAFALVHNWLFNWRGFVEHLQIVREMGGSYRMFPPTLAGQIAMSRAAVGQIGFGLGWPLFLVCLFGIVSELASRRAGRALWLLTPALSYYVFFIGVVGYHYDRFFMPILAVLAIFGGGLSARLLGAGTAGEREQPARWRLALVATCLAYTLVQGAALDALMLTDSRYEAERWLREHLAAGQVVGFAGEIQYLPRLAAFKPVRIRSAGELGSNRPDVLVANPEFFQRFPAGTEQARLYAALQDPRLYVCPFRHKAHHWWNPLTRLEVFSDAKQDFYTNLDKINPTVEIYRRPDRAPHPGS